MPVILFEQASSLPVVKEGPLAYSRVLSADHAVALVEDEIMQDKRAAILVGCEFLDVRFDRALMASAVSS